MTVAKLRFLTDRPVRLRRHLARVNAAYEAEVARVRAKHRERGRPEAALNPSLDLLLQSYENALEETPLPSVLPVTVREVSLIQILITSGERNTCRAPRC